MGQGGLEVKLGSDLDFQTLSADGKNVFGDPSSIAGRPASAHSRSFGNMFTITDTQDQAKVDSLVSENMSEGGSHCWEKDGGFHIVCIFVVVMGIISLILSMICAFKIYKLVMYSSLPSRADSSLKIPPPHETDTPPPPLPSLMVDTDRIVTVQTELVVVHNNQEESVDIVKNNCLC